VRESDEIDSAAWAKLLTELLAAADLTPEQAARPNGPVPANWRSIRRWLSREQGVSAAKVRDVARALGYSPAHALVEVGFLERAEVGLAPPARPQDPLVRRVDTALTDQRLPDDVKSLLRRGVQAAYDLWLDMYRGRSPKEPSAAERERGRRIPR